MIHYCLPLQLDDAEIIESTIEKNEALYTYFEIWLDFLPTPEAHLTRWCQRWPGRLLFLLRRPGLAPIQMPLQKRYALLRQLASSDAWLDLDIHTQQDELSYLRTHALSPRLIASYHNYETTPPDEQLTAIVEEMKQLRADICKLATYCQTPTDALRLMMLGQQLSAHKEKHIVLGMGPYGTLTRVYGTLWGNEMIFAPQDPSQASAPGQLTYEQLQRMFAILDH